MRWQSNHLTFAFILVILTAPAVLPHTITNALAVNSSYQQQSSDDIFQRINSLFTLAFQHDSVQTLSSNYLTTAHGQGQDYGKLSFSGFSDATEEHHESAKAQVHENEHGENTKNHHSN